MNIFYLDSPPKSWVDSLVPLTSLLVSVVALIISGMIARWQRELQVQQLRKDLFDRRYDIYTKTREFVTYVIQFDGDITLNGPEYRQFQDTMEKAEMLCEKVHPYLREIMDDASELYVHKKEEVKIFETGDASKIKKATELRIHLFDTLRERRNEVFRPYLNLELR